MPNISIVIPVYNAEKFIKDTLECIINQTFKDFECIIVNDGSTDKSLEIIDSFVAKDKRFECATIKNSGSGFIPRTMGIKKARGEFIFYMDADDSIDIDCLEKMYLRQNETNADIVLLRAIGCEIESRKEMWRLPLDSFDMKKILRGVDACALTINGWQLHCNGMLAKIELFRHIPVEKGELFIFDEIASRYLLYYAKTISFADTNYYYKNNSNSITRYLTIRFFERLLIDQELEEFVNSRFDNTSNTAKQMRISRFFNMVHLQSLFILNKRRFSIEERKKIKKMIKDAYYSQDINKVKNELSLKLRLLFLNSFSLFRINAVLYAIYKKLSGSEYIFK